MLHCAGISGNISKMVCFAGKYSTYKHYRVYEADSAHVQFSNSAIYIYVYIDLENIEYHIFKKPINQLT